MSLSTILFDAGGTLVFLDYFFVARELRRRGVAVSSRDVRKAEYAARADVDRRLSKIVDSTDDTRRRPYFVVILEHLGVDPQLAEQVIAHLEFVHKQDNLWRRMMPSTPAVLQQLKSRGVRLGVVSNSDGRINAILQKCGIARFFEIIIDSHVVGVEKPAAQIFTLALQRLQSQPQETLYVGDIYEIDVVGSGRAGLHSVLLDTLDLYNGVSCQKIRHLRDLLAIV